MLPFSGVTSVKTNHSLSRTLQSLPPSGPTLNSGLPDANPFRAGQLIRQLAKSITPSIEEDIPCHTVHRSMEALLATYSPNAAQYASPSNAR
jgi:hypothetical protein